MFRVHPVRGGGKPGAPPPPPPKGKRNRKKKEGRKRERGECVLLGASMVFPLRLVR